MSKHTGKGMTLSVSSGHGFDKQSFESLEYVEVGSVTDYGTVNEDYYANVMRERREELRYIISQTLSGWRR